MRKILSFLMMTLFSVSMFAAEPVTVKSTFTKATKPENNQVTDLEGKVTWDIATTVGQGEPTYVTGQSNSVEAIKFGGSKSVYFSKVELSTDYFKDYNVTSLNFYVANNGKKTGTLTVKQGSETIGTTSEEFGNAWTKLTATGTNGKGGTLTVTYEVEQAFYLSYIEVTYEAAGGEDPEPDPEPATRTLYCKVAQSWWKADGAAVGIYAFKGDEKNAAWPGVRMTLAENETDVWTATIDAKYEKVIFVRVNASGDIADWGAKTADLTLADAGENDLYTVTSTTPVWGDPGVTGTWSKYSPSESPAQPKYFLKNNWDGADTWTWKEMTYDEEGAYYYLTQVVFGGTGVNLNTTDIDAGSTWIAAKDIITYDLSYEPATLGALDTVFISFDPQAVNKYTGENGLFATILGKYVAPAPQPVLADGFYLIGKIGGVAGWAITDLKAEQMFAQNQENPGEYMLNVTLAEGDELKVVNVLNNEIATWYPGDDNFIVTAAYAGEKTVYFRPDGQGGEGWHRGCIYIAPNPATGISNNAVEGKAVKMIMDGQLLIIRNGKTYNVQGQQLK